MYPGTDKLWQDPTLSMHRCRASACMEGMVADNALRHACRRPLPEPMLLRKAAGMPQTVYIYPDGNLTLSAKAEKASIAAPTPSKSYQISPLRIIVVRASSYSVSICMAVEGKEHLRSHRRNMQSSPAVAMRLSWCRAKSASLMGMEWAWLMLPLCCIALKSCSCKVRITFRCIKMYLTELRL